MEKKKESKKEGLESLPVVGDQFVVVPEEMLKWPRQQTHWI